MKKGAVSFSGFLTLLVGLIMLFFSVLIAGTVFNLGFITNLTSSGVLATIYNIGMVLFITPLNQILTTLAGLDSSLVNFILEILLIIFSLFLFIWGIKEMTLRKKADDAFARCKKTCMFPLLLKLFASFYCIAFGIMGFVLEDYKKLFDTFNTQIGVPYLIEIIYFVIALLLILAFIIPLAKFSKMNKLLTNGGAGQYDQQPYDQGYGDQQNGYSNQYYNYTQTQPLDPNSLIDTGEVKQGDMFNIVPGQNGVPYDITQKGIEDLGRLERLKASGAIDEANYQVMKQTICANNSPSSANGGYYR